MAISEAARADLYTGLTEVLGGDRAELIMSGLALHEFDEVATKTDLVVLRAGLEARMDRLEARLESGFAELRAEFAAALAAESAALRKSFSNWMLTLLVTIVGAMVGVGLLT